MKTEKYGKEKHGCYVDNEKKELIYYNLLNLVEKIQRKPKKKVILYQDIVEIKVYVSVIHGVRYGSTSLTLEVILKDGNKEDISLVYYDTTKDDLREFIYSLKESSLPIIDSQNAFEAILSHDGTIGTILDDLMKK